MFRFVTYVKSSARPLQCALPAARDVPWSRISVLGIARLNSFAIISHLKLDWKNIHELMMTKPNRSDNVLWFLVMPEGRYVRNKFVCQVWATARPLNIDIQQILCSKSKPVVARGLWGRFSLWWWPRPRCLAMPGPAGASWCRGGAAVLFGSAETRRGAAGSLMDAGWTDPGGVSNARNTFLWILFRSPQNLPHPRRNFLESRVDRRVALMQGTRTLPSVVFPVSVTARHAVWSHFPV